jgi:putative transposase
MRQIARNVTMEGCGTLRDCRYLLHDRDTKYTPSFRAIIVSGRVEPLVLPARSPNLNAYAERWVEHYHAERNHRGKDKPAVPPRYKRPPPRACAMP